MASKQKNVYKKYNPEDIKKALDDIRLKKLSVRAASKFYKVPFSTLLTKHQGKYPVNARPGPATILTSEEENALVKWILHMSTTGFCVTKEHLLNSVQKLVKDLKRETPFTDGRPSKRWYQSFLNRHPQVSLKSAENLSLRRAEVSEENIRNWFQDIKVYLESKSLLNISGSRVFNCDESSFLLNPKSKKVLTDKNQKKAYIRITTDEKECLTVLITGNADGQLAPPMILFAYERIPGPIAAAAPAGWSLGHSKSGWMIQESFYEYVTNVFYKWCLDNHLEFPIILFVDGHRSHLTLALSDFCVQHKIELIALYPNATHLLQPMDVALFRPLKLNWSKVVATWRMEHDGISVNKESFAPLLNKAISMLDTKKILGNGFRACGLYPFLSDAVNYSRLLLSNKTHMNQSSENEVPENKESCIRFVEKNILPKTLECFKMNKTGIWTGEVRDENLFYFWLKATSKENHSIQKNVSFNEEVNADGDMHQKIDSEECTNNLEQNNSQEVSASSSAYLNTQENITDIHTAVPMNENTIWIIHENGTITQEPILENDQIVTLACSREENQHEPILENDQLVILACSNEENQHASTQDLHSIQNLSVGDENLNPNIKPVESLNVTERIQNKHPVSIVNLDEKAIYSPSPKKADEPRILSPFKRCLFWPEQKQEPQKRKKIKIPAVATSDEWRAYHQSLIEKRKKAEEEKIHRMNALIEKKKKAEEEKRHKINVRLEKLKIKKEKDEEKKIKKASSKQKPKKSS